MLECWERPDRKGEILESGKIVRELTWRSRPEVVVPCSRRTARHMVGRGQVLDAFWR